MELHHSKHHQTYVNSFNDASEKLLAAQSSSSPSAIQAQIALQPLINFHGGGHINHTLFWENLAPKSQGGGEPPTGQLAKEIDSVYGGLEEMKKKFNAALAGVQGSGWAWLVKDAQTGGIAIRTYANQDPVVGQFKPLLGVDAWEHAVSHDRKKIILILQSILYSELIPGTVLPAIQQPQSRILCRDLGRD